jgi:hypothetical protein
LRARQEATSIPNLLVAPKDPSDAYSHDSYADDIANAGYYEDGAYYTSDAVPTTSKVAAEADGAERDPQLAYFDSILSRFEILRAQLQQTPPPEAVAKLGATHPILSPSKSKKNHSLVKWWRSQMQSINPLPAQIASMDKSVVLRALRSLTGGRLLRSGADINVSVSLWTWALLARLPERGELSSEEIGVVRELGKRAVLVGISFSGEKDWQEGMHEVEAGLGEEEDDDDEGTYTINDEEIQLDIDEDLDAEADSSVIRSYTSPHNTPDRTPQIGPHLPTELGYAQLDETYPTGENLPKPSAGVLIGDSMAAGGSLEQQSELEPSSASQTQPLNSAVDEGHLPVDELQAISEEAQVAAAKARILANLHSETQEHEVNLEPEEAISQVTVGKTRTSRSNTRATVDMIITVVGEMYGQRDLLEFRPAWGDNNIGGGKSDTELIL